MHHKKVIHNLKKQRDILIILVFITLVILIGAWYEANGIISPCPNDCINSLVQTVYAVDESSELNQTTSYIVKTFEPEGAQVVIEALEIANCESKMKTNAYNFNSNGSSDYSLFQINSVHTRRYGNKFMHDWKQNVDVAHKIYRAQGWNPWVCARTLGII